MDGQLFRKQSMDHISSPEQLHDYMRVTGPRLWMILSAILALLIGFIIYASMTRMESTVTVPAEVASYETDGGIYTSVTIVLPPDQKEMLEPGMEVRLAGIAGTVDFVYRDNEQIGASVKLKDGSTPLPDGTYDAEIVTESTTPISFLLN